MLTFHRLYVGSLFAKNLMDVGSSLGFELVARSMPSAGKYRSYRVGSATIRSFCFFVPSGCLVVQGLHGSSAAPALEPLPGQMSVRLWS